MGFTTSFTARFLRERLAEFGRHVPVSPQKPDPLGWSNQAVTAAWLGHATVLINFYGVRILTDPALFSRVGVDAWVGTVGPKRLVAAALRPSELPEIDLVLVSHAHFDHLDTPSLAALRGKPVAVMAKGTSDLLPRRHFSNVVEMAWGENRLIETARGDLRVRAIEVRHWGARLRHDDHRGYNGYILEREGRRLLFGGDTAQTPLFREYRRYGPFEVAMMPIGAYEPWIESHCTPEQSIAMADAAGARLFLPIHHQSFRLSYEPIREPIERAQAALASEPERLALREIGETAIILAR